MKALLTISALLVLSACSEPKSANICDLAKRPSAYQGKLVRVTVNLIMGPHGAVAYGPQCPRARFEYGETAKFDRSPEAQEFLTAIFSRRFNPSRSLGPSEDFQADVTARVIWLPKNRDAEVDSALRSVLLKIDQMHSFRLVKRTYADEYEEAMDECLLRATVGLEQEIAQKACGRAVELRRTEFSHFLAGLVALDGKRYSEARAHFDAALSKNANNHDALYGRGLAEKGLGKDAEARRDMNEARRLSAALPQTDPAGEGPIWFRRFNSELPQ